MNNKSFIQKLHAEGKDLIVLIRTTTPSGDSPLYVYIRTTQENVKKLEAAYEQKKPISIMEYGEILESGRGEEPPGFIKKYMEQQYQFKHNG